MLFLITGIMASSCCNNSPETGKARTKDAIENILSRKSVRKFSDKPVEQGKIDTMLRAGMSAPSGKDIRPWEFIVVTERAKLDSLAVELPYAKMLETARMAIIVCGDSEKSGYWYLDCSAAAQNVLLAAEALGLGAVWTATYPYEERMAAVNRHFPLPEAVKSLCVIPVGYPAAPTSPKDKWDESKIHTNGW